MKTTAMLKLAASTLILATTIIGCSPATKANHPRSASEARIGKAASKAAFAAQKALGEKDYVAAVRLAEVAVSGLPRDAGYRMLLGQAYLAAGRFSSAETAFSGVLTLMPDHDRAALNLALVQIATGKSAAALTTLNDYRDRIGASDYGLALALAGDAEGGVRALETAVREPRADAKARQNLALAYALSGEWTKAHVTAAQDLSPADADARIIQWAAFAKPGNEIGRVATLLGVQSVADAGQPTRLALVPVADAVVQVAEAAPLAVPVVEVAAVSVAAVPAVMPAAFEIAAPARAVHMTLEAPVIYAATTPVKRAISVVQRRREMVLPKPVPNGQFVVQLGAYESAAVSRDAWNKAAPRFGLKSFEPVNSSANVRGASFVRLSVGGFATRADAAVVCLRVRAAGGGCFVRGVLGDKPVVWARGAGVKGVRVASR